MPETEEDDRMRQLQEALDSEPNNHSHHYNFGHLLWERAEKEGSKELKEGALEHFLVAAKLNPNNGTAFRYLGHYYSRVSLDAQRASKCYQRAVSLNPDDFEAGEALCELLDGGRKESLEVFVCREASERSPRAFWAFRRLGYLQVHQRKWSEGVQSLQHAIRGYPNCADLWEALGLAYRRLGMYTAAVKSYERAVELEDSKVFALVESGNIHMLLGSFRKGVDQFRSAMEIAPCNISAHFGLASALLGLSKGYVNSGAFSWGASLLEEASEVAKACTSLAGNFSSSWKLYGDIQIAYAKCFPWTEKNDGEINEEIFRTTINSWKRTRLLAAICAHRSYQRALHLTPWQATIYIDIAISSDLIHTYEERKSSDLDIWPLPEKMCLGGLMLEGENNEFWVVLGCLSNNDALKQHAFIRGLQLDVSLSIAWAYLGKLYRKLGEKKLAKQAFDRARSIDPSLALPWAGMSADTPAGDFPLEEAYDSCLRAVQIMPLAEFQVGLGILGALSSNLLSPQVFGAVRQAVQHAPFYPESHNLNGLVCEVRSDYPSAISAYRLALYTFNIVSVSAAKSHLSDVSFNLARSLCKAGHAFDAAQECEDLKKKGLLDNMGLQIYAVALCQLGKTDQALTEARHLGVNVSTMDPASGAAALGLICKLIYHISGLEPAAATILKIPKQLLQSSKTRFIVSTISAFDPSCRLQSLHPNSLATLASREEVTEMHSLIAFSKMISDGSKENIGVQTAVDHLRKALHTYPDSCLIRNQLSSLLLSSKDWMASHTATKCIVIPTKERSTRGLKSPYEILGSAAVACYATCTTKPRFSFPTCDDKFIPGPQGIYQVQKWLHQEPWNNKARYLLILIVLQKAREEKFPQHLRVTLKRLVQAALSKEIYLEIDQNIQYQKFQLLLCSSEICLQIGDYVGCIYHATDALRSLTTSNCRFFAHLQLCRAYAALEDWQNLNSEFMNCLRHKTDYQIGWISLKYLESRYKLQNVSEPIDLNFGADSSTKKRSSQSMWLAIFDLACCQNFIWDQDFVHAEKALGHAQAIGNLDSCLLLCHGAICMELARQRLGSQFLSLAVSSLTKAQENSAVPLPLVSALLAQAEASLGARTQWEKNLRSEWFSWPAEMRPAELYFQMLLLAKQPDAGANKYPGVESSQSPERWILRAIHVNPSCSRYWKVLQKLMESSR